MANIHFDIIRHMNSLVISKIKVGRRSGKKKKKRSAEQLKFSPETSEHRNNEKLFCMQFKQYTVKQ